MRFMVITKATEQSEAGEMPGTEDFERVGSFIQELTDAGVLLAADGLHPSSQGARIYFDGDDRTVVDGPFAETKELVAGYYLVETKSLEECVAWFKRHPNQKASGGAPASIEIRRVFMPEDFGEEFTAEQREAVERRESVASAQD